MMNDEQERGFHSALITPHSSFERMIPNMPKPFAKKRQAAKSDVENSNP